MSVTREKAACTALLALLTTAALLAGCVHRGPLFMDFRYQAPKTPEAGRAATVAVSPLIDARGRTDSLAGRRFSVVDDVNDLVVQGTVADKVTEALKSSLRAHGLGVESAPAWDLTEAGIPAAGAHLVVGGEIKNLWVEALDSIGNTTVTVKVDLRIVVADAAQRKIIRTLNVTSSIERGAVAYSRGLVQGSLSEALTAALNQIYQDEELKQSL